MFQFWLSWKRNSIKLTNTLIDNCSGIGGMLSLFTFNVVAKTKKHMLMNNNTPAILNILTQVLHLFRDIRINLFKLFLESLSLESFSYFCNF